MSSLLDSAIKKLYQYVDSAVADVRPFRAIVTGQSSGMVTIRRLPATTGETALRARCVGFDVATSDEVLCVPMADAIPVVVAKLQRATPTGAFTLPVSLQIGGSSGATIRTGSGTPEGSVTGSVGDLYLRSGGAAGTTLYEKATGSGNTGWLANDNGIGNPDIIAPVGLALDGATASAMNSNSTYAIYMGKADRAYTSMTVRAQVMTAAATITWAELGIGTSPAFAVPDSVSITRRGYTNVAATFNATGELTTAIAVSGIARGDNLWLLAGSQATTPYQLQAALGGLLSASQIQFSSSTRISTMASPKSFTAAFNSAGFYALMSAA